MPIIHPDTRTGKQAVNDTADGWGMLSQVDDALQSGDYKHARTVAERAMEVASLGGSPLLMLHMSARMGLLLSKLGVLEKAVLFYKNGLGWLRSSSLMGAGESPEWANAGLVTACRQALEQQGLADDPLARASVALMLGSGLRRQGETAGAQGALDAAVGLFLSNGQQPNAARAEHELALLLESTDPAKAEQLYLQAAGHAAADLRQEAAVLEDWGEFLRTQGRTAEARPMLQQAVQTALQSGDAHSAGTAFFHLAAAQQDSGNVAEALAAIQQSANFLRQTGAVFELACAENTWGSLVGESGDPASALPHFKLALESFQKLGAKEPQAKVLFNMGWGMLSIDRASARGWLNDSLILYLELGNELEAARCFDNLAVITYNEGGYLQAAVLWREAQQRYERAGSSQGVIETLCNQGEAAAAQGSAEQAKQLFGQAAQRAQSESNWDLLGRVLVRIACAANQQGELWQWFYNLMQARRLYSSLGWQAQLADVEQRLQSGRSELGEDLWSQLMAAWQQEQG